MIKCGKTTLIISLIIIFHVFTARGQEREDSLENICLREYTVGIRTYNQYKGEVDAIIKELFPGYFDNFKIFFITNKATKKNITDILSRVFVYDLTTFGHPALSDSECFLVLNKARKEICNLDKCYLYAFFQGELSGLLSPGYYSKELTKGSLLINDTDIVTSFYDEKIAKKDTGSIHLKNDYPELFTKVKYSRNEFIVLPLIAQTRRATAGGFEYDYHFNRCNELIYEESDFF